MHTQIEGMVLVSIINKVSDIDRIFLKRIYTNFHSTNTAALLPSLSLPKPGRNTTYNCAHLKDEDGRLPLHLAAEMGVVESEGLREIIDANVDAVQEPDGLTGLFPFALARGDLNTCFSVLLQNPAVMDDVTRRL